MVFLQNFSRSSGSSSDESKVSEDATHTNGRGTPTFLEFRVCSLPAVSTVAQIIAGVSLEHLTKHVSRTMTASYCLRPNTVLHVYM